MLHDLLEGVVPFELALVLKGLISKGVIALTQLNAKIRSWKYGPLDKRDRPVEIGQKLDDRIKQNAARMWCLLQMLPLMLCEWIAEDDPHWLFLLQIKDISFAHRLSVGHVLHLQQIIQDHIFEFNEMFPNIRLKPKHHFLLHYAVQIKLFGPLRQCWCMRFEGKHYYFIHMMRVVNNLINPCSTLATHHQYQLAYRLLSSTGFLQNEIKLSVTVSVDMDFFSEDVFNLLISFGISNTDSLHQCKFITLHGVTYYQKMYLAVRIENDIPIFGRIEAIYIQTMEPYFLMKEFASEYVKHKSAYHVTAKERLVVCKPGQ